MFAKIKEGNAKYIQKITVGLERLNKMAIKFFVTWSSSIKTIWDVFVKETAPNLVSKGKKEWLVLSTVVIILAGLIVFFTTENITQAASYGDFFAGFAASLAFLWLAAGYRAQVSELAMQREELKLQRKALEGQVSELKRMSKHAAIDHVKSMIELALQKLKDSEGATKKPADFFLAAMPSAEWKVLLESIDADAVNEAYIEYLGRTGAADSFVIDYAEAAKFYLKSVGREDINYEEEAPYFVVINEGRIRDIPYLSSHVVSVKRYSEIRIQYEPADKMFQLAILVASEIRTGANKIFEGSYIKELIGYLKTNKKELPAIARGFNVEEKYKIEE